MILLHKFISVKTGIYSTGYYLSLKMKQYYEYSMILTRGKFTCDTYHGISKKFEKNLSHVISMLICPHMHHISFNAKNFSMDLIFEKDTPHYILNMYFPDTPLLYLTTKNLEQQIKVYNHYYNVGKNNKNRYRRTMKGSYEI